MTSNSDPVTAALDEHGELVGGLWGLPIPGGGRNWYPERTARAVVEACLILDVPVSGTITGEAWLALAKRIQRLEERR